MSASIALLLTTLAAIGMVTSHQTLRPKRDPAIDKLDFFLGTWKCEAKVLPGRFGPGGPASGMSHYKWSIGGKWLMYDSEFVLPSIGPYEVHGVLAYDEKEGKYVSYAFNNLAPRGVEYRGEWKDQNVLIFTSLAKSGAVPYRGLSIRSFRTGRSFLPAKSRAMV